MGGGTMTLQDPMRCRIDDFERLRILERYRVVDTPAEASYEWLVEAMHTHCRVPMAAIAFVDSERMWMKAQRGFAAPVVPRSVCFCSVCMHESKPLVVEDARRDPRFRTNPLVTSEPSIRFYAGFPMFSREGYGLGSVCVVDTVPRTLLGRQMELLERTRDWVQAELEIRRLSFGVDEEGEDDGSSDSRASQREFAGKKAGQAWRSAERIVQSLQCLPA